MAGKKIGYIDRASGVGVFGGDLARIPEEEVSRGVTYPGEWRRLRAITRMEGVGLGVGRAGRSSVFAVLDTL